MADLTDFYARAAQLGHSREDLEKHGEVHSVTEIRDMAHMRELMRPASPEERERRQQALDAVTKGRPIALTEAVEAYVFGSGELTEEQVAEANKQFPMQMEASSGGSRTITDEVVVGPSAPTTVWNYDTLNVGPNGSIRVENTIFVLKVTTLNMQYVAPTE